MADTKDIKEKNKETSKSVNKLVEEIAKLSVLELSQLVEALQDKLGVSAAPTMAAPVAGAANEGAGDEQGVESTSTGGTVVMTGSGDNKIAVIKALREINQEFGLKEAKDMTENLPVEILKDAKPEDAKDAIEKLKAAGATVELK